jgi:hypothetical protein
MGSGLGAIVLSSTDGSGFPFARLFLKQLQVYVLHEKVVMGVGRMKKPSHPKITNTLSDAIVMMIAAPFLRD